MNNRIIEKSRVCFDPILVVLAASNAFVSMSQYLSYIPGSRVLSEDTFNSDLSVPIQPSLHLYFPAPASGLILKFNPSNLLIELAHNREPSQMYFTEESITIETNLIPEGAVEMPNLCLFRKRIIQSVFIDFYETQKNDVNTK